MINIAQTQFGCGAGDVSCYCSKMDFAYGVRDCSNEACSSSQDAATAISFATAYCQQALGASASGTILTGPTTGSAASGKSLSHQSNH